MFIRYNRRSSIQQIEVLLDKMEANLPLASGKMRSKEGRARSSMMWEDIAHCVNCEGPPRTARDWAKVWIDLKFRVKSKVIQIEEALSAGPSGGDVKEIPSSLSPLEERVAAILRLTGCLQAELDTLPSQMEEETINEGFEDSNTSEDAASPDEQESFPKSPLNTSSAKNGSKLPHNASPTQHGLKFTHASSKRKLHDPPEHVSGKIQMADSRVYQLKQDDDGECTMFGSVVAKKLSKLSESDRDVMMAKILQLFADERHNFSRAVAFPMNESTLEFEYVDPDNR